MNTSRPASPHVIVSLLSVLFYWLVLIVLVCLFLLMEPSRGGRMGTGDGNGSGVGNGMGTGAGDGGIGSGKGTGVTGTAVAGEEDGGEKQSAEEKKQKTEEKVPAADQQSDGALGQKDDESPDDENGVANQTGQPEVIHSLGTLVSPVLPASGGRGKVRMSTREASQQKGFFGGEEVSGRVLFLVDVSPSMQSSTQEGLSRIQILKRELEKVLNDKLDALTNPERTKGDGHFSSLPKNGCCVIVTFSGDAAAFPADGTTLSFTSKKDLENALDFVKKLQAGGSGTEMKRAWDTAIPLLKKNRMQSVYFMSDGEPTDCGCGGANELLNYLGSLDKRYAVHTISLGISSSMMEKLAQQHHGQHREVY